MPETKDVLIKVRNLKTYYPVKQGVFKHTVGHVKAVDDVSLDVYRGEILSAGKEHRLDSLNIRLTCEGVVM